MDYRREEPKKRIQLFPQTVLEETVAHTSLILASQAEGDF